MPRRRSILLRLAGLVLVASAINAGVCLLLAWQKPEGRDLANLGPPAVFGAGERRWVVQRADSFGGTAIRRHVAPQDWPAYRSEMLVPWWSEAWAPPTALEAQLEEQTPGERKLSEVAYGWPFRAMKYE